MDSVSVFLEIVRNGSISKTAEQLGCSQSNISHILSGLEEELDVTLLIRGRQGIRLTTEGETLMPYFREIENARSRLDEKVRDLHGLVSGKIRVAVFPSVYSRWMPRIIKGFHDLYPLIELDLLSGSYPTIEDYVLSGAADCGFVHLPTKALLETCPLKQDPFYAILPTDHRLKDAQELSVEQLSEEPLIMSDDLDENEVAQLFRSRGCMPAYLYTVPDPPTVCAMVREGLGVSVLTDLASENVDGILRIPLQASEMRRIGLAVGAHPSAAVQKFSAFVQDWVNRQYR